GGHFPKVRLETDRRASRSKNGARARLLFQETFPTGPGLLTGFLIGLICIRSFPRSHEAVSGTFVDHWIEGFARGFHLRRSIRKRRINSRIVSRVKPIHWGLDSAHGILVRRTAIEYKSAAEIRAVGGEAKALTTAPAEAGDKQFSVRRRKFARVIGHAIEIGRDLIGTEVAHGFRDFVRCDVRCASPIRPHS